MENIQPTLFGKMSPVHLAVIKGMTLKPCLKKSQKSIFQCLQVESGVTPEWLEAAELQPLGDFWTLNIGEYPNEESVSTLSEVLEAITPSKYYLSATACEGILRRSERRGKKLPPDLETALKQQAEFLTQEETEGGDIAPTITGDHCSRINDYAPIVLKKFIGLDLYNNSVSGNTAVTVTTATGQDAQNTGPSVACLYSAGFNGQNSVTAAGVDYMEEKTPPIIKNKKTDVFCLQGSMIGREDKNGPQENGINKNISFTVNTADRHAVVYALDRASFNQGINAQYDFEISDNGINSTIVAKGPSAVAYKVKTFSNVASTLRAGAGAPKHEADFVGKLMAQWSELNIMWIIRRLTPLECERLQGYPDFWTCLQPKATLDGEEFNFWRDVMVTDKKIKGKRCNEYPTPTQLTRWYNKLECDGSRYKALGNSLAIPCALRVIGYIADFERTKERNINNVY